MYVRVHGDLKSFNNRRSVNATSLKKVTDHNEVQYHLLETVYVHLYHTRGPVGFVLYPEPLKHTLTVLPF